jgi:hypothetical protein
VKEHAVSTDLGQCNDVKEHRLCLALAGVHHIGMSFALMLARLFSLHFMNYIDFVNSV